MKGTAAFYSAVLIYAVSVLLALFALPYLVKISLFNALVIVPLFVFAFAGLAGSGPLGGRAKKMWSGSLLVVAAVVFVFTTFNLTGGALGSALGTQAAISNIQPAQNVPLPTANASITSVSLTPTQQCTQLTQQTTSSQLGAAATVTLNDNDQEAANPASTNVDVNQTYAFAADSLSQANAQNQIGTTITDTSNNPVTGFTVGQYIVVAGGSSLGTGGYYLDPATVCVNGAGKTLTLSSHAFSTTATGALTTTVFDSGGATELSAGAQLTDYTVVMSANQKTQFWWKITNQRANTGFWLAGVGFIAGFNISQVFPVPTNTNVYPPGYTAPAGGDWLMDPGSMISSTPTPLYLKSLAVNVNNETTNSITATYTVFRLKTPIMLHQFQSYKFLFEVDASGTDPSGNVNTTSFNGVLGLALDGTNVRTPSGQIVYDIHDNTPSQLNVGLIETLTSPSGKDLGFSLVTT